MKNLWDPKEASQFVENSLQMRVYSSRLLGNNSDLVLHGGGNTSVKFQETNLFGEVEEILYVKGSGYNLATIEKNGFTPLRLKTLRKLVEVENLSDAEMVRQQQMAMTNPDAPIPSVEALLHAVIPFKWIDHTHADAVVTITNTPSGKELIQEIYGERLFIIPYVMPGFKLVHKVNELARNVDWNKYEGMVLLNHGIFSFAESVLESYTRMIDLVSLAEKYLEKNSTISSTLTQDSVPEEAFFTEHPTLQTLARIRRKVSEIRGSAMLVQLNYGPEARSFSNLPNVKEIATRGPITSDHLIRTKPVPAVLDPENMEKSLENFASGYKAYFDRQTNGQQTCLDCAPRWGVWPGKGTVAFGRNITESGIISDIVEHTVKAIQHAEAIGGWKPVTEKHLFEAEYWKLQQAKLKPRNDVRGVKNDTPEFEGKIALVSGAASGIGLACVRELFEQGAVVVGLDLNPDISNILSEPGMLGIECDVTDQKAVSEAVLVIVRKFGGLDVLVLNAGTFPAGQPIEEMDEQTWSKSLAIN